MKDFIKSKIFVSGFLVGIFVILLLNFVLPTEKYDGLDRFGFPFSLWQGAYEDHGGNYITEISWLGLIGDLVFALFIGALAGSSLRLLADRGFK